VPVRGLLAKLKPARRVSDAVAKHAVVWDAHAKNAAIATVVSTFSAVLDVSPQVCGALAFGAVAGSEARTTGPDAGAVDTLVRGRGAHAIDYHDGVPGPRAA
jgi:hypothetical protein